MAAASCLLTEDQFLCSICLDVFTDPVSIPCGHNFCKTCITKHWDVNVPCQCPNCNKVYLTRPELQINTFISEMAAQFRRSALQKTSSSSSDQQVFQPGEVLCDVCTELKAVKSCLVCLTSYCETHLEPHLTKSGLKRHQLIDPLKNLEERMCKKHDKLLELFCKTDQMCVCVLCTCLDHKTHEVVHLKEEFEEKKTELEKTEAEIHQMIQKREQKIQEIKLSVELRNKDADRELEEGVQVFTALKESIERSQAELIKTIKQKQRTTEKQAEDFIKELEQEIFYLKKRSSEVEQLSQSEDHLHLLQGFSFLKTAPPTKNLTEVSICLPVYEGSVRRAVNQLEETLTKQMKKLMEVKQMKGRDYAMEETLDCNTVYPQLMLSNNNKEQNKINSEVDRLSVSDDDLNLLQRFVDLNTATPTKDWTEDSVCQPIFEGCFKVEEFLDDSKLGQSYSCFEATPHTKERTEDGFCPSVHEGCFEVEEFIDHNKFSQSYPGFKFAPLNKNKTEVCFYPTLHEGSFEIEKLLDKPEFCQRHSGFQVDPLTTHLYPVCDGSSEELSHSLTSERTEFTFRPSAYDGAFEVEEALDDTEDQSEQESASLHQYLRDPFR